MKKILFLHSSSELYGSDRSLLNLISNLEKDLFEIHVILPEEGPLSQELNKIEGIYVEIKSIAVLRRKYFNIKGMYSYLKEFIASIKYLIKYIKKNSIDIVYTNTSVVFPGGIAAKLMNKKNVWHVREIIKNKYEKYLISNILNIFSDVIIANSKATADALNVNPKKIKVVYNAISEPCNKKEFKVKNHSQLVVGMAGRINRWKGQKLFVDVAEVVLNQNPNVVFKIAGDVYKGENDILVDLRDYIAQKKLTNKIKLLGQVNDMVAFYESIDIFILPSIQPEPFGLVVIEAMQNGLPVVATNHGGPTEIITDKKDGFLVEFENCNEMASVVLDLLDNENLRKQIGVNAIDKVNLSFGINQYVSSISEILRNI